MFKDYCKLFLLVLDVIVQKAISVQIRYFSEQKAVSIFNANNSLQIVDKVARKDILTFNSRQKPSTRNKKL